MENDRWKIEHVPSMRDRVFNPIPYVARYCLPAATAAGVLASALLCSQGSYIEAASILTASVGLGLIVSVRVPLEAVMIFWFAATPFASYYLRFPAEKSILTFDRAVFGLALVLLIIDCRRSGREMFSSKFEIAWALLSAIALSSAIISSNNIGYATRIAVDSFWLPLLAFHIARHHIDLRGKASAFILATMALALVLFFTGAYELRTGTDLFNYPGSQLVREGELRVNGPFMSDSSYSVICLILGLFLWASPSIFRVRLDGGGRLAHRLAVGAVTIAALLPLFRAVALAMIICWAMMLRLMTGERRVTAPQRSARLAALALSVLAILASFTLLATRYSGGRVTDLRNAVGRLATWESAAEIALENPVFGVGMANYIDYFEAKYLRGGPGRGAVLEVRAANTPHSNLLWIAAELGMVAFVLYLAANVYILRMGLSALGRAATFDRRAAAGCFLALVAAYWIPGLTLSSGVYSDLNLYLFFLLGLLSGGVSRASD
ncbi:MAG TPA: O-antigen ligase family protein [Blastocatellia bacterium]|nr:O-antigen ligase family protein [Blastocatellia bacterium]